eukprot:TRINITY_DN5683_c0_g1_i1.p1 TRINITY_DN5683_c0_g1~~TRINITY_DN5683_c0_g1_i1.p1  ORF type:complete len:197 (+),score=68.78 TRINITY_DN5683_c0_g1_i1:114-704(+)
MSKVDVKVVLLGKATVGKTCLVERFLHGKFRDSTVATVGAAFGARRVVVNGKEITLGVWDTAGQERYESMSKIYYRSARAAIVCYDMNDEKTYEKVQFWVDELQTNEDGCEIYIVGTKADLLYKNGVDRRPSAEEVAAFARSIGAKLFETSAKTGAGIDDLFYEIARSYVARPTISGPYPNLTPPTPSAQKSGCPC